jgi:Domain of unknown function (DUF6249)
MSGGEVVVPIFFFITVGVIWGAYVLTRHKERLQMIEKGLKADEIKSLYARAAGKVNPLTSLKWGMIFVGIGVAVLLGVWLHAAFYVQEGVFPGLIALFGGAGLIVFYVIARRKVSD